MNIIVNYLLKGNGKDNCLKSHFCLSCKNDEMSLKPFWHNTVDVFPLPALHNIYILYPYVMM